MILVSIIKNWDWPDLMRQTPGQLGIWDDIQFTVVPVDACDFAVMLNNNMKNEVSITCPPDNIWALMQEPYAKGFTDWMIEGHDHFSRVYTNYVPADDPKYMISHPAIPWHVNRSYDQLSLPDIPVKTKSISWIVGNARDLPGHLKRLNFLKVLQNESSLDLDLFGRAVRKIEDKWDGLAPYKYSLAIENSCSPNYWTEKLADCFLTWTIPIYYGCKNLEEYFSAESFIRIDIDQPDTAVERIKSVIQSDDWEKRLPALKKAREQVLNQYQLFPYLAKLIRTYGTDSKTKIINVIPPYRKSIKTRLNRVLFKVRMGMMRQMYK